MTSRKDNSLREQDEYSQNDKDYMNETLGETIVSQGKNNKTFDK